MELLPGTMPPTKFHGYMLGIIGPRPICFASTVDKDGKPNLAPFSFFNIFSANPPTVIFSPARSGITGNTKHTYQNVKEVPEVVVNIVNYPIIQQVSLASTAYPKGVNEFIKAGFTPVESDLVKPFRVKESPASLECKVKQVIELGDGKSAGNLIICEILKAHIKDEFINEAGKVDQYKIQLVGRMAGNLYCHAIPESIFEVIKPISTIGIGVDRIPDKIRYSKYLTGNDLGVLGNVEKLPDEKALADFREDELAAVIKAEKAEDLEAVLHKKAHQIIEEENDVEKAWKVLLNS